MGPGTSPCAEDIPKGEGHGQSLGALVCLGPAVKVSAPVIWGGSAGLTEVGMGGSRDPTSLENWMLRMQEA